MQVPASFHININFDQIIDSRPNFTAIESETENPSWN
jgi:hypothetical protein